MPGKRIARALTVAALAMVAGCARPSALPDALDGNWEVQQIAGASLGEGVRARISIDARRGRMSGFTGCNNFSAPMTGFGDIIAVGAVDEVDTPCPSAAAETDETRLLMVLGSIGRYARHGRSLELLPREPGEALIQLRYADGQGGA